MSIPLKMGRRTRRDLPERFVLDRPREMGEIHVSALLWLIGIFVGLPLALVLSGKAFKLMAAASHAVTLYYTDSAPVATRAGLLARLRGQVALRLGVGKKRREKSAWTTCRELGTRLNLRFSGAGSDDGRGRLTGSHKGYSVNLGLLEGKSGGSAEHYGATAYFHHKLRGLSIAGDGSSPITDEPEFDGGTGEFKNTFKECHVSADMASRIRTDPRMLDDILAFRSDWLPGGSMSVTATGVACWPGESDEFPLILFYPYDPRSSLIISSSSDLASAQQDFLDDLVALTRAIEQTLGQKRYNEGTVEQRERHEQLDAKLLEVLDMLSDDDPVDELERLLSEGADPNAKAEEEDGDTALGRACDAGNAEAVKLLLAKSAECNARGEYSRTPLMIAAGSSYAKIIQLLLGGGAEVGCVDDEQKTALIIAAETDFADFDSEREERDFFQMFIDAGTDLNAVDEDGQSALAYLEYSGRENAASVLRDAGAKY